MMDGNDFIALAGKLAAMPSADEATYRTAVSRAYYGALHIGRSLLVELGFEPVGNANVHAFVRHYLNASGHPEACLAATELSDLQTARNRADYRLDDPYVGSRGNAIVYVERAHGVVSDLERCRAVGSFDLMRQAIAEYERRIGPRL
jgi:uncharacterized protein (UPF0332 family)